MIRALVIALMVVATPLASCHSVAEPRTVAEARPELAVAYEAGLRAWVWLDARNAALYEARAELVREAILSQEERFVAECGDSAPQCMLAVFDQLMTAWEKESGYDVRSRRLETARQGLAALREALSSDPNGDAVDWLPAATKAIGALSALVDELRAAKVGVPDVVSVGLRLMKALA
jgi:hypothetical protein